MLGEKITEAVEELATTAIEEGRVPGLSIAVVHHGAVFCKGYGSSNVELNTPAGANTVYKIGSISKHFLASAVMLLTRDGLVNLDAPLDRFFGRLSDEWRHVTLRHLLTHTAGLPRDPARFDPFIDRPLTDYVRDALSSSLRSRPGDTFTYSNLGYFIVADVIQRVAEEPFGSFLRRRVFKPASLNETSVVRSFEIVPGRASSYLVEDGILRNAGELRALRPSGAVLSSVADLARWAMILLDESSFDFPLLQELSTPAHLTSGEEVAYGFGLFVEELNGQRVIHHDGGLWCFRTQMLIFPRLALAVIVMANSREADATTLALNIAAKVEPELHSESPHLSISSQPTLNY